MGGQNDGRDAYDIALSFPAKGPTALKLYLGPLEYDKIKAINRELEKTMNFGWGFIRPISKGVLFVLKKMHEFIPNYGYVLILFSFAVKLLVYPLTKKSYQSTAAMQQLQPEIAALKDKHSSNPQKLNQATMKLYKEKGVNPLGGCLPMLLQMPLLFALFQVFRTTIELRAEPFVWWIKDLSAPDAVFTLPFSIPIYGSHVAILPILMVVSMFIQQRMMSGGAAQQPQQKTMQYFMTGFFFLMFNSFPSGLNLYYTLFNVLTIAQQKLIPPAETITT
jgi:YidC/Oxa1 family membrane protein insertase